MLNLATTSNSAKGISAKTFRPTVKQARVKHDLVFSEGRFTIAAKFLENQLEHQGWNVDYTPGSDRVLLVQTLTEDKSGFGLFLKGEKPTPRFKSDAAEFSFKEGGLDMDQPFTLTLLPEEADTVGFNVFVVTTEDADSEDDADELEPATVTEQTPAVEVGDVPTLDITDEQISTDAAINDVPADYVLPLTEDTSLVGITDVPVTEEDAATFTQEQINAYAQVGVEEQSQDNSADVNLL